MIQATSKNNKTDAPKPRNEKIKGRILAALAEGVQVQEAARFGGIARCTFYDWLRRDVEFAAQVELVQDAALTEGVEEGLTLLRSVMRDKKIPLQQRLDAAGKMLNYEVRRRVQRHSVKSEHTEKVTISVEEAAARTKKSSEALVNRVEALVRDSAMRSGN